MSLKIQIYSLIFSFLFGIYFSYILSKLKRFIYHEKILIKTIFSLVLVIINSFIFFIVLNKINNGILHPYIFITLVLGFYFIDIIKKR